MLTRLALIVLSCYKSLVSPFIPPACRFHPSCSEYSQLSIRKHGLLKGICLTFVRLSKCHPFHPGGFDPVP